jgi:lysophospholipase L1-like esterase
LGKLHLKRPGLHLLAALFVCVAVAVCPARAKSTPASLAETAPILCVGDSLTFGVGGGGVTYPGVLAVQTGVHTVNLGLSGFIPRHIVYHVLLHELPSLSRSQLEGIPPSEYEERKNQPEINHLRTFLIAGQTVWVKEAAGPVQYCWDPAARENDPDTIKPSAVGDPAHHPLVPTGRWRRLATPAIACPAPKVYRGIIFCVGANGMDADDITRSLHTLLEVLAPSRFLVLGLINRVDPDKHPEAIALWARCIAECNQALRSAYPDSFLELQPRFAAPVTDTNPGGYRTRDWFKAATAELVAHDEADQARSVLPFSLRYPDNSTHLNATGYTIVGQLAGDWVKQHGWLKAEAIP